MSTAVTEGHDLGWKLAWAHRGWAGPDLLDTYEAEWRPIGARRTARSAREDPERDGAAALAEDLNHRLPHAWLPTTTGHPRSTLDLLGPGLTLLTGPADEPWIVAAAAVDPPFPLEVHALDPQAAGILGIGPTGAALVRPDAQVIACWPATPPDPRDALLGTGWFGEPVSPGGGRARMRRGRRP